MRQIEWQTVKAACEKLRTSGKVSDPLVRHAEGVAMMILGPFPDAATGPFNTLANAHLEMDAGRNFPTGFRLMGQP